MRSPELPFLSHSPQQTEQFAEALAPYLLSGTIIALEGPLGAGKTLFARGLVHGLGDPTPYVTSPTFTLMNPYSGGRLPIHHFDLYRLSGPDELLELGVEEFFAGDGIIILEWAERGAELIPHDRLTVRLEEQRQTPDSRLIHLEAGGVRSQEVLDGYRQQRRLE